MTTKFFRLAAVLLGLVACGGGADSTAPKVDPRAAYAGTWTLQTIDGHPLPYRAPNAQGGKALDILTSQLTLNVTVSGSEFRDHSRYVGSTTDIYDNLDVGWGPQDNNGIVVNVILPSGVRSSSGTVNGNVMTLTEPTPFRFPSGVYVYIR